MATEELFKKPLSITLKSNSNTNQSIGNPTITIKVTLISKPPLQSQILEIQLTDDNDPYFLYISELGDEDFRILKQEQALLVDFAQFPYKIIELFELCIQSGSQTHPKFIAQLRQDSTKNSAIFSVVETNSFKSIDHLSLKFVAGNDSTTKQYLGQLVKEMKVDKSRLENQVELLSSRLQESENYSSKVASELNCIKAVHADEINAIKLSQAGELLKERERFNAEKDAFRRERDETWKIETQRHSKELKELTEKLQSVTTDKDLAMQKMQILENKLQQRSQQLEKCERDLSIALKHAEDLSQSKQSLALTSTTNNAKLETLISRLEQSEKNERAAIERELVAHERVNNLESKILENGNAAQIYKGQNDRLQENIKALREDVNKGNDIIRKLQTDVQSYKSKLKMKNVVTLQQEKLLEERSELLEVHKQETLDLREKNNLLSLEVESLKESEKGLNSKLEELKKTNADNSQGC